MAGISNRTDGIEVDVIYLDTNCTRDNSSNSSNCDKNDLFVTALVNFELCVRNFESVHIFIFVLF